MEHTHQLVKVTNLMLHLFLLLLPLHTTTPSSATATGGNSPANGAGLGAGKSGPDAVGPIIGGATIASSGRERSHLKGAGGCNRVVFSSNRIRNGSIAPSHSKHSGLFPSSLCQLYEFVGDGAERVQIIFSEFRLPSQLGPTECGDTDILMVYYIVNEREELVETLCGDTLPKPILSDGPRLLLELRSSYNNTENKGFTGDFFFLTNFGITTGYQPNQSECTFHYFRNVTNSGWIQSPNFPGAYPRNIICNYFFHGGPKDFVRLRFTYFDIEGIRPCDEDTASDYVEFSNFVTRDRKYDIYCGKWRELVVRSDGRFFRITMTSNDRLDGTGFRAIYTFETVPNEPTERTEVASIGKVTTTTTTATSTTSRMCGLLGPVTGAVASSLWVSIAIIISIVGLELIKFHQV
ncbi:suppressor of lurcher protein 1 [Anopheles stephensi]|uniref:suppressor of lurcher protein 1 n=1 Tax=Anopheles stephensi TaxID=30069 RepID=UPI001658A065|nr:suppressor of lurcher protein 1 [Anopheles stephensi]XP_035891686.1 suppressor of lurcher protein 1 [Anopheles stephensi]XP_035891689.1 suppressor of lurcher protein 1 [Anopheles stephensi]XP_035891690.1 suppressor of lurcher protein 1 [Anopheles stephensi]XP_035891691.1 suppressor of lurcher protein 1 [Anopheles stephensi]XP_035891692.1 suppressor of lurcher protein 1 [Anopheles stephensi]XP_035891693.1 suppressor of lurcher protein 1 [Anopheles stephensi]XP_035891694.1 suppressor of lur